MISQSASNYAKILYSLNLKENSVEQAKNILFSCCELMEVLENPTIKKQEKEAVIESLFEKEIVSFIKVLCDNMAIGLFPEIIDAYHGHILEHKNIIKAKLAYAIKPEYEQIEQIKRMLCDKYEKIGVDLELAEDTSLIAGFVLYVGDTEYDKSIKGALTDMQKTLIGR